MREQAYPGSYEEGERDVLLAEHFHEAPKHVLLHSLRERVQVLERRDKHKISDEQ